MSRENLSLIPFQDLRSLSARPEEGLTEPQLRQISRITKGYLKEYRLGGSYQELTFVMPVIRSCIQEGLKQAKGAETLEPGDNLAAAYKIGYEQRRGLLNRASQEFGTESDRSILALPVQLVRGAGDELSKAAVIPNLTQTRAFVSEVDRRRPVFLQLLNFAKGEVEKVIPGSTGVTLDRAQEAGLVRNLLFNWVSQGKTLPLLETEDILSHTRAYSEQFAGEEREQILRELCEQAGITYLVARDYMGQLGQQINDLLRPVSPTSDPSLPDLDRAFRQLEPSFLLINPFYKLEELSQDPHGEGATIWDRDHAVIKEINGVRYRIVLPETLRFMSYRRQVEDRNEAIELEQKAKAVADILSDLNAQEQSGIAETARQRIVDEERYVTHIRSLLRQGTAPTDLAIPEAELAAYVEKQRAVMSDERVFPAFVRDIHQQQLELAFSLLHKYQNGSPPEDEDIQNLIQVRYGGGDLFRRVTYFLRERLINRLRNIERMYASRSFYTSILASARPSTLLNFFPQSLQTTVIDVLEVRSQNWLLPYTGTPPIELSPSQNKALWSIVIEDEERAIDREFERRIRVKLEHQPRLVLGSIDWYSQEKMLGRNKEALLSGDADPLRQRMRNVHRWSQQLDKGELPFEDLPKWLLTSWQEGSEASIRQAITTWLPDTRVSVDLPVAEVPKIFGQGRGYDRDDLPKQDPEKAFIDKLKEPYGTTTAILEGIATYTPRELWFPQNTDIRQYIHGKYWTEPLWGRAPTRGEVMEGRRKLANAFRRFLQRRGYNWNDEIFSVMFPSVSSDLIKRNGYYFSTLFKLEGEISDWLNALDTQLITQLQGGKRILSRQPGGVITRHEKVIGSEKTRLRNLQIENDNNRVRKLQSLEVILPEVDF